MNSLDDSGFGSRFQIGVDAASQLVSGAAADHEVLEGAPGARLRMRMVKPVPGVGLAIVGQLSDPLGAIEAIHFERRGADPLPLTPMDDAGDTTTDRGFADVGTGLTGSATFVALIAEPPARGGQDRTLAVRLRDAGTLRIPLSETGALDVLTGLLDDAPLSCALTAIAQIIGAHRAMTRGQPGQHPFIKGLAGRVFSRIGKPAGQDAPAMECYVDTAIRIGDQGILIKGWLLTQPYVTIEAVSIVALSGRSEAVRLPWVKVARPDVIAARGGAFDSTDPDCGYVCYVPVPGLHAEDTLWSITFSLRDGTHYRAPFTCGPTPAPMRGIFSVTALAEVNASDLNDLFADVLAVPIRWFWALAKQQKATPAYHTFGTPPAAPMVSVIVPLYGRIDFVRHQVASFSNDPNFRANTGIVELIYVLDDPTAERELMRLCRLVHDVYGVPFRVVLLGGNFGYSCANNAGAAAATGELLVLLNSDVIPKQSKWVERLARHYTTLDKCAVLGCRLLFEDGSIQHAGISFRASPFLDGAWGNDHPGKGLSVSFDLATKPAEMSAVCGACLMIERALFQQFGGLSEDYVIADFEDSDLCLRMHETGLKIYYTPDVELYHLERQSMQQIADGHVGWRQSLTLFNMWQHAQRWKTLIPVISERYREAQDGPAQAAAEHRIALADGGMHAG